MFIVVLTGFTISLINAKAGLKTAGYELDWNDKNTNSEIPDSNPLWLEQMADDSQRHVCSSYNIYVENEGQRVKTSYDDYGFEAILSVNGCSKWMGRSKYINKSSENAGDYKENSVDGIELCDIWFCNDYKDFIGNNFTQVNFVVKNTTDCKKSFSLATVCDLQVGTDDNAYCRSILSNDGTVCGFTSSNGYCNNTVENGGFEKKYCINVYAFGMPGVTDADNVWVGFYRNRFKEAFSNNILNNSSFIVNDSIHGGITSDGGLDTGFSIGWQNRILEPGEQITLSYLLGANEFQDSYEQKNEFYYENDVYKCEESVIEYKGYGERYITPNEQDYAKPGYQFLYIITSDGRKLYNNNLTYTVTGDNITRYYYRRQDDTPPQLEASINTAKDVEGLQSKVSNGYIGDWTNTEVYLRADAVDKESGIAEIAFANQTKQLVCKCPGKAYEVEMKDFINFNLGRKYKSFNIQSLNINSNDYVWILQEKSSKKYRICYYNANLGKYMMPLNSWIVIGNKSYYQNFLGYLVKGWNFINNNNNTDSCGWYYFNEQCEKENRKVQQDDTFKLVSDSESYYFNVDNGSLRPDSINKYIQNKDRNYSFNLTNYSSSWGDYVFIDKKESLVSSKIRLYRYLNRNQYVCINSWCRIKNEKYLTDNNGNILSGWVFSEDMDKWGHYSWYYFGSLGTLEADKKYGQTVQISSEGIHKITISAKNYCGEEAALGITVRIDRTAPVLSALDKRIYTENGIAIDVQCQDELSGVDTIILTDMKGKIIARDKAALSYAFPLKTDASYIIKAIDKAGNETKQIINIKNTKKCKLMIYDHFMNTEGEYLEDTKLRTYSVRYAENVNFEDYIDHKYDGSEYFTYDCLTSDILGSKGIVIKDIRVDIYYKRNMKNIVFNVSRHLGEWMDGTTVDKKERVYSQKSINLDKYFAVRKGWEFIGWSLNPESTKVEGNIVVENNDVELYAVFRKKLRITFTDIEKTSIIEKAIYNNDSAATIRMPKITEYDSWMGVESSKVVGFSKVKDIKTPGAYTFSVEKEDSIIRISDNTDYYAVYEGKVKLTYDPGITNYTCVYGNIDNVYSKVYVNCADVYRYAATKTVVLPDLRSNTYISDDGYLVTDKLNGWKRDNGSSNNMIYEPLKEYEVISNTHMIGIWSQQKEEALCNVEYKLNIDADGDVPKNETIIYNRQGHISNQIPKCTGRIFQGWSLSKDGKDNIQPGMCIKDIITKYQTDIVLYAKWKNYRTCMVKASSDTYNATIIRRFLNDTEWFKKSGYRSSSEIDLINGKDCIQIWNIDLENGIRQVK